MYSVLACAINHPDAINPYQGLFNNRSLRSLSSTDASVVAVSPRPIAPPVGPYSEYASLPRIEECESYPVHHPRFWYLLPKRLFYAISGRSYARRVPTYVERSIEMPDVVHACHIYPDGYGILPYVRDNDLPLFVVSHGAFLNDLDAQPYGVSGKILETLDAATGVLCVSDDLADTARSLTDPSKVTTVPIGADPEAFPVDRRSAVRRELGVPDETTLVLFVGEFNARKGVPEFIEILERGGLSDATVVCIGHGGALESELAEAVAGTDAQAGSMYSGVSTGKLRQWFAAADVLLLPSHAEGRPTVIYEAMASETAVLASDIEGISEQVVAGKTGRLVPPGDVEAFRAALRSMASSRDRCRRMGEAGRERLIEQEWTWTDHTDRVRALHLDAIP